MHVKGEQFRIMNELSGGAKLLVRSAGSIQVMQQQGTSWAVTRSDLNALIRYGFVEQNTEQPYSKISEYQLSKKGFAAFKVSQESLQEPAD